jgi:23S rRNA pseudouridine1911/1915/1917 synthase
VGAVELPPGADPDSIILSFPVAREFAGQRVDRFIQLRIPRLSRVRAAEIVRSCAYRADGTRRRPGDRVRAGETVYLVRPRMNEPDVPRNFGVIHEDDDLLAVDKPSGLPMHPSATYHKNTLTYVLRERYGDKPPHIAHRLDRETSGIVLCGKHLDAERALKSAFERRKVSKTYLAITRGRIAIDEGRIDLPLAAAREGLHLAMEVRDDGAEASTTYRVRARASGHTLVELSPHTGRQHQLRVHLSAIGHPIVGDKLYGPEGQAAFVEFIDTGLTPSLLDRLGHERQALHAHRVSFPHPAGMPMELAAPLADDLERLWAGLAQDDARSRPATEVDARSDRW